ncbi:YscQ/HrcQ family type III secretion apparatus protein [Candidatus Symbiopectobacterium sp. NZEC135]|uniref:YscQ/HrcQ family type III secretion apparatus protein n=1 Tax=Candidatus Symbiopectobacterium sp. NZEC135 TaxID=2820471 RepID=UPI00222689D1|nr:YscQ/HrcQ family type III secretion apparatus protein [Candidatus Symbiopectobacterium sp. NZEC135]MCW2481579.1 YscQ/HrcQ family type III secretion apparatus protein [Candidatus Symbiopectobacterium sp. NZEC135]
MLRTTRETWSLAQHLPPEGVTVGELHIGLQTWTRAQSGVVITLSFDEGSSVSHVWLEATGWSALCEQMLGTADVATVDALLLEDIAEWVLSPLLAQCQASMVRENAAPCPCSALPEQWGVVFTWQVEQVTFQAVLFGNTDAGVAHLHALIAPDDVPTDPLPPLRCALYAGECELSLSALRRLTLGVGIAIRPYGDLRAGHFVLSPLQKQAAYVQINGDNTMHCRSLGAELENSAIEMRDPPTGAEPIPVDLAALPQKLLVEVGQVTLTLGSLRTLQVGDTVAVNAEFSPEVTLKLNGCVIGKGVLIGCGDRFLVQIRQWYLSAQD